MIERWLDVLEERAIEGKMERLESRRKWRKEDENRNGNGIDENHEENGKGQDLDLDLKEDELIDKPLGISREDLIEILDQIGEVLKKKNQELQKEKTKEGKEGLLEKVREINRKCEALMDPRDEKVGGSL